ncbi:unnamed protein product, partial [marine sediment metagenome]
MKSRAEKKRRLPVTSSGTIKACIFVLLVGITIAIWVYTQLIFAQVREFQKSVVRTHVGIYVMIIDPLEPDVTGVGNLYEEVVKNSPFPRIISDENLNPIQGLWLNVGIDPDSTDEDSYRKLRSMIEKMDKTNPPEHILMPRLEHRTDTLTVYECPSELHYPVAITDTAGTYLYARNITGDPSDISSLRIAIEEMGTYSLPLRFIKDEEPTLIFHGINPRRVWPLLVMKHTGEPLYWNNINIALNDTTAAGRERLEGFIRLAHERGVVYDVTVNYNVVV